MSDGTDIPKETGVDNSDIKSMTTDGTEEMEILETDAETCQWDLPSRNYST